MCANFVLDSLQTLVSKLIILFDLFVKYYNLFVNWRLNERKLNPQDTQWPYLNYSYHSKDVYSIYIASILVSMIIFDLFFCFDLTAMII